MSLILCADDVLSRNNLRDVIEAALLMHGRHAIPPYFVLGKFASVTQHTVNGIQLPRRARAYAPADGSSGGQRTSFNSPASPLHMWQFVFPIQCGFNGCDAVLYVGCKAGDTQELLVYHVPVNHKHEAACCQLHRSNVCQDCIPMPATCNQGIRVPSLYGSTVFQMARLAALDAHAVVSSPSELRILMYSNQQFSMSMFVSNALMVGNHSILGGERCWGRLKSHHKQLRIQELPGRPMLQMSAVNSEVKRQGLELGTGDTALALSRLVAKELQQEPARRGLEKYAGPILKLNTFPTIDVLIATWRQQLLYSFMCKRPLHMVTPGMIDATMQIVKDIEGKRVSQKQCDAIIST